MYLEKFKKTGNFELSSGLQSNIFYDLKEAMGEPRILEEMARNLCKKIVTRPDIVIGIDYGGIPLAIAVSMKLNIPFAIIRKKRNTHGMGRRVEGYQEKGTVLLIDDVFQTGRSMDKAQTYLTYCGYKVIQTLTILERNLDGEIIEI